MSWAAVAALEWQHREWSTREKVLDRAVAMVDLVADRGDNPDLIMIPLHGFDAGRLANA